MRIGIPAEIGPGETRVAATPETVKKLTAGGRHSILVQSGAGSGASIPDSEFIAAGATIPHSGNAGMRRWHRDMPTSNRCSSGARATRSKGWRPIRRRRCGFRK